MSSINFDLHERNTKVAEAQLERAKQFIKKHGLPFTAVSVPIHYATVYKTKDGTPVDMNTKEFAKLMSDALVKDLKQD